MAVGWEVGLEGRCWGGGRQQSAGSRLEPSLHMCLQQEPQVRRRAEEPQVPGSPAALGLGEVCEKVSDQQNC